MPTALEAWDEPLNATTLGLLGDTITYTPSGGEPLSFTAIVDYGDTTERLSGSKVVTSDVSVEVPVNVVSEPTSADVIDLPKTAQLYQPKDWLLDQSGDNWIVALKKKPT
jgi:hypothetical protein